MTAFAIALGTPAVPVFLGHADLPQRPAEGWQPFLWTRDRQRAEMFGSPEAAEAFAASALPHDRWRIVTMPFMGSPSDTTGGSPVAMRMAA